MENDPQREAWEISFFDENHLNYATSPDLVASPAQMRFMVYLDPEERYYPCSDRVFQEIMDRVKSPLLGELYNQAWARVFNLMEKKVEDVQSRTFLTELLHTKFAHETANYNVIPSRLEKRLFKLFMVTTQIEDPLRDEKHACNRLAASFFESPSFIHQINQPAGPGEPAHDHGQLNIESTRRHLDATKLRRMLAVSVQAPLWERDRSIPAESEWTEIIQPAGFRRRLGSAVGFSADPGRRHIRALGAAPYPVYGRQSRWDCFRSGRDSLPASPGPYGDPVRQKRRIL
nr:hypothetical protein [uncultured Sphaerochaeta sp.]